MIFRPELAELILSGQKTETRRPVKHNHTGKLIPCRYEAGKTYAIQLGRGKKQIGRLHVLDVSRQELDALTEYDARREGFKNRTTFMLYWIKLYRRFKADDPVWVIRFELCPSSTPGDTEEG